MEICPDFTESCRNSHLFLTLSKACFFTTVGLLLYQTKARTNPLPHLPLNPFPVPLVLIPKQLIRYFKGIDVTSVFLEQIFFIKKQGNENKI
jgi:hypothetical protein